ncbi:hypothetical protein GQ53DRAFT_803594 [Thozetella sp. PMI_491]|nr:hypothetical protein GQ53DRAFT_803594 [Thozetella sp. PMI_491]
MPWPRALLITQVSASFLTCRMSSLWPDDLALSVTYFLESSLTLAVVFGCNATQRKQIEGRLRVASSAALTHPLLLPGIFAELERKRLSEQVEDILDRFTLRTSSASVTSDEKLGTLDMSEEQMAEYLQLCYRSQSLAKEFKAVKRQLSKMVQFCDSFGATGHSSLLLAKDPQATLTNDHGDEMAGINDMIRRRILEIMDEYDARIDECVMVVENMSITMQTVWSHIARRDAVVNTKIARANTSIALDAKQDNGQMKSIAFLTMVYLPVSAVASIFSMTMFNWSPQDGSVVSSHIWVFVVVAAVLTIVTLAVWYIATRFGKTEVSRHEDLELGNPLP